MKNPSPLLLETIKIEDGEIANLPYHQKRCNQSRKTLFNATDILNLSSFIKPPPNGLIRCRIVYDSVIRSIEYIPYQEKEITSLKIVPSDIEYSHKFNEREVLNTLRKQHKEFDDIIIEKKGYLTDTSIANIAFYNGEQWVTPEDPLLEGTMRAKLIAEGLLIPKKIKKDHIKDFTHLALINAMIGFKLLKNLHPKEIQGVHNDH